jgi:hypothetical protein
MSKKLLFNEGGIPEKVPVLNKYTGTKSGYLPIEENSVLLDVEEKTYIQEVEGNTIQDSVNLSDINSVGELKSDGKYDIDIIQGDCPYTFGEGGRL